VKQLVGWVFPVSIIRLTGQPVKNRDPNA